MSASRVSEETQIPRHPLINCKDVSSLGDHHLADTVGRVRDLLAVVTYLDVREDHGLSEKAARGVERLLYSIDTALRFVEEHLTERVRASDR